MSTRCLEIRSLTCSRGGQQLFSSLNQRFLGGECWQIAGANGSGKTTLLRILAGLLYPSAGEVLWQGKSLAKWRDAYFQQVSFLGHLSGVQSALTVAENIQLWQSASIDRSVLSEWLSDFSLLSYRHHLAGQLSAGQRQRVALVRLMLQAKPLWILDEPLSHLDQTIIPVVAQRIQQHATQGGCVLLSTHLALPATLGKFKQLALSACEVA